MVCDVTLVLVQVRSVILIKELALPAGRIRSHEGQRMYLLDNAYSD